MTVESSRCETGSVYSLPTGELGVQSATNHGFGIIDGALGMCTCLKKFGVD